jgi:DNA topoisomerase-3
MKVILTEKPSVARDIAKALGKFVQNKDHIRAGEYVIVWAMGHLLEIDDSVAPEKWDLESLPIFPEKFLYKVRNSHFFAVKKILSQAKEVIVATDAGREGELIARLILIHSGWKAWDRTYRLWTSKALTPEVVRKELKALKPIREFDSLFWSALARQHADWLVGINLTRAVSLKAGNGVWSVGRVQTPTLALIVKRTIERENFKPQPYFVIKGVFSKDGRVYEGLLVFKEKEEKAFRGEGKGDTQRVRERKHREWWWHFRRRERESMHRYFFHLLHCKGRQMRSLVGVPARPWRLPKGFTKS